MFSLQAGRPRDRSSILVSGKGFVSLFSNVSRPALKAKKLRIP